MKHSGVGTCAPLRDSLRKQSKHKLDLMQIEDVA